MVNKVNLCGYVGQDPTIRDAGGTRVAQFSLATSRSYKDRNGERKKETQWHSLVVWGKQAEVVERYVRKGSLVQVFGEICYRVYEDNEGVKRQVTDIRVNELVLMPSGERREQVPMPQVPEDVRGVDGGVPF